jgi:hypothetical protein
MTRSPNFIRTLNPIEQALTISNAAYPLCVVIVLHLEKFPDPEKLQTALRELQHRHVLLQCEICRIGGKLVFRRLQPLLPIPLEVSPHNASKGWQQLAEASLNTHFDEKGPLMKIHFLKDAASRGEMVLTFHHAIIDGVSARLILHELLSLLGDVPLSPRSAELVRIDGRPIRPTNLAPALWSFLGRQLNEEWVYRKKGLKKPPPVSAHNRLMSLRFSPELSRKIITACTRQRLNPNNLLLAAITLSVIKHKYAHQHSGLVRVVNFAHLGQSLSPPADPEDLGCYISMLRLTIPFSPSGDVVALAAAIRRALVQAGKKDEIRLMAWLSKYLIKMSFAFKNSRLGISALSYIDQLDLEPQYGSLRLGDVQAFITNNPLGPEFAAFGKILFGRIGLDFTYLEAETTSEQAKMMVTDIENILTRFAENL